MKNLAKNLRHRTAEWDKNLEGRAQSSPTLAGIEKAEDLATLEQWIREIAPDDAEAILHDNAARVVRATLHRRAAAGGG